MLIASAIRGMMRYFALTAVVFAAVCAAPSAYAEEIDLKLWVENGSESKYVYTGVHDASRGDFYSPGKDWEGDTITGSHKFFSGGTKSLGFADDPLSGFISATLDTETDTLTFNNSTLKGSNGKKLVITGGSVEYVDGFARGSMDYDLHLTSSSTPSNSGTFYFYPIGLIGANDFNKFDFTSPDSNGIYSLKLFGNNWENHVSGALPSASSSFGLSLFVSVPEPGTIGLMGSVLVAGAIAVRRRRRREA